MMDSCLLHRPRQLRQFPLHGAAVVVDVDDDAVLDDFAVVVDDCDADDARDAIQVQEHDADAVDGEVEVQ